MNAGKTRIKRSLVHLPTPKKFGPARAWSRRSPRGSPVQSNSHVIRTSARVRAVRKQSAPKPPNTGRSGHAVSARPSAATAANTSAGGYASTYRAASLTIRSASACACSSFASQSVVGTLPSPSPASPTAVSSVRVASNSACPSSSGKSAGSRGERLFDHAYRSRSLSGISGLVTERAAPFSFSSSRRRSLIGVEGSSQPGSLHEDANWSRNEPVKRAQHQSRQLRHERDATSHEKSRAQSLWKRIEQGALHPAPEHPATIWQKARR